MTVLEASLIEGHFAVPTPEQRHLGNGIFYDIVQQPRRVELSLLTAVPGDANGDGRVDGIDLTVWNDNRFGEGDWTQGDFTGDGLVDGSDFDLWNQYKFTGTELAFAPGLRLDGSPPRAALNEQVAIVVDSPAEVVSPRQSVVPRQSLDSPVGDPVYANAAGNLPIDSTFRKFRRLRDRSVFAPVGDPSAELNWDVLVDDVFAKLGTR